MLLLLLLCLYGCVLFLYKIVIEATTKLHYGSDIAIDDIIASVFEGKNQRRYKIASITCWFRLTHSVTHNRQ